MTAARDVVSALGDLQNAQNDFLNVWVNYEVQRLNLDLDLGTMNLDPEGYWIDPGPIGDQYGYPTPLGFEGDAPHYILDPRMEPELLPEAERGGELPEPLVPEFDPDAASRLLDPPVPQRPAAEPAWPQVGSGDDTLQCGGDSKPGRRSREGLREKLTQSL